MFQAQVDQYFAQLDKIVKTKTTSSRVRFMIQDLADLRSKHWVPRREDGPKTIDAIHKEAEQESQDRQVSANTNIAGSHW